MRVLVTAGNTAAPIDRVRCLTNVFTGRTGTSIARAARRRGHAVALATSHPALAADEPPGDDWAVLPYRTFDDLREVMARHVPSGGYDALVHCAAVSDYLCDGVFAPAPGTAFLDGSWAGSPPALLDRAAGKVKSDEPELWLRLRRAPKLVDSVRGEWGFRGVLVKFKLEVGLDDEALLKVAEASRAQSHADLMVANTLEGAGRYAFLGAAGGYARVTRAELAERLLERIETCR